LGIRGFEGKLVALDAGEGRAFFDEVLEFGEGGGWSGGVEFHFAAGEVADPSVEAEALGVVSDEGAESDALNSSGHGAPEAKARRGLQRFERARMHGHGVGSHQA
jgi:hypothetical protein